ncbi:septum site-determining protein Ssd [Mycobacterium sp. smrl_JER01]|uniref:septum site-determining protein Ssd n=1 Tax=Mycobacterium sp. smrl_JER01 TaxID=3402633 RepID=UPI003ACB906A
MTVTETILVLVDDRTLGTDIDRVVAAAGVTVVRATDPSSHRVWTSAAAILLDTDAARRCAARSLPRRARVVLISHDAPTANDWEAAVAVGAQHIVTLPAGDRDLMAVLADAADAARHTGARGPVVAVLAGRGGGGASIFATALARSATAALLIDGDPWGGGLDLVLGTETDPGLRWPDLSLADGRVGFSALYDALPRRQGVSVLSGSRVLSEHDPSNDIDPAPLAAVIEAGSRAGVTVVCDVARRPAPASELAVASADLVVLVTPADVRSCSAAAATARWVLAGNPNAGVVVRGPSPGGLRACDVARIVALPVLASMRPQPGIDAALERGGLRVQPRSPLARAAREVLAVLSRNPQFEPTVEVAA